MSTQKLIDAVLADMLADMQSFVSRNNTFYYDGTDFVTVGRSFPKFDTTTEEDKYEIVTAVPGYKKEDFELTVTQDDEGTQLLSLKSGKQADVKKRDIQEIHRSSFHRSIRLPKDSDTGSITSSLVDGLLTISIPRVKKQKQTITIQ